MCIINNAICEDYVLFLHRKVKKEEEIINYD